MVKRSGAHTAKPNEPTKLGQFLMQRLRAYQDGKDLISRQTAFEAGKIAMVLVGGSAHGVARALPLRVSMAQVEVLAWAAAVEAVVRLASSLSAGPPPRSQPPLPPPPAQCAATEDPPPFSPF